MSLPRGLFVCASCDDITGVVEDPTSKFHGIRSTCLCGGIVCPHCGARTRRPITDHYVEAYGYFLHTPAIEGMFISTHLSACARKAGVAHEPELSPEERAELDREWEEALERARRNPRGGIGMIVGPPAARIRESSE